MNSVLALHEILHETKKNGKIGVVLKLDFEKAYDKAHWASSCNAWRREGSVQSGVIGLDVSCRMGQLQLS
jgi:hypothetical protein